jgi:acyl carrier protein
MKYVRVDRIIAIFERVLEDVNVLTDSDFFRSGGDSLLATRVLSKVAREFGVELTFAEFTQASTPEQLAQVIGEQLSGQTSWPHTTLL